MADAIPVVIDSDGQLGTVSSSAPYKEAIADMGNGSSSVMDLRPVTFRYIEPYADGEKPIQYGLIAEEVAEVFPDLVVYNEDGVPETVRYHLLSVLLLNELQAQEERLAELEKRLHQVEQMEADIGRLESVVAALLDKEEQSPNLRETAIYLD